MFQKSRMRFVKNFLGFVKPSKSTISDSDHYVFIDQIALALNTAICTNVTFPGFALMVIVFLKSRKPDSPKGLDNISYRMLQALHAEQLKSWCFY